MLKNRTYLPSGKTTPRPGVTCVAKNGALKSESSKMELPRGLCLDTRVYPLSGSARSTVTDAAENRMNTASRLIMVFTCLFMVFLPFTILLQKVGTKVGKNFPEVEKF